MSAALTLLQKANQNFKAQHYAQALKQYQEVARLTPQLSAIANFNIALTNKRLAVKGATQNAHTTQSNQCDATLKASAAITCAVTTPLLQQEDLCSETNITPATVGAFNYTSLNEDPHFYVTPSKLALITAGFYWLQIDIQLENNNHRIKSKLYLDYGNGFNEQDTLALNLTSDEPKGRVVYIAQPLTQLRFDPKEMAGSFLLKEFSISAVNPLLIKEQLTQYLQDNNVELEQLDDHNLQSLYQEYDRLFNVSSQAISYQDWIRLVETPDLPTAKTLTKQINQFKNKPLFSIVMPTYNTQDKFLRLCIDSVLNQSYPHWELCIADDKSPNPQVKKTLQEYAKKDARIKVVFRTENGHISKATNSAIKIATGDFIVLLDHDDALAQHALFFMAQAINQHTTAKVFYSDEDKIDTKGQRSDPHFKSDWNPDLFYSQNYVSHLGVYKTEIIKKIGGFRTGVEGSQDQDLLLRCLPHVKHNEIIHIPKVLYHWRMIEGSTALASGEKSYTTNAGIKALQDHFAQNGPQGVTVQAGLVANTYKVNWPIPKIAPFVSLLIPTRDRMQITKVAVDSILQKTTYQNYEIIILDNGSVQKETLDWFAAVQKQDPRVKVLRYDHPFNYSAINNYGVAHTQGEIVGLINNDIEVINPEWLTEMLQHAIRSDIGCVGAKLYYANDLIQHAGVIVSLGGVAGHSHKMFPKEHPGYFHRLLLPQNLSAVTAAVLLVRREVYQQVKGLNEHDLQVAFNDVDFCLKVREAGYRNLWTPYAELYHHESISRGHEDTPEKQARFAKEVGYMKNTWGKALVTDPYYSPNLTKDREDFGMGI